MEKGVPYNLRASKIVIQPKCQSTTHGPNSLTSQGVKLWNSLPEHIKGAETVGQFQGFMFDDATRWFCLGCIMAICDTLRALYRFFILFTNI